ncbi:MAG: RSP_7527 family protein [Geminicoccaceae bacterium]
MNWKRTFDDPGTEAVPDFSSHAAINTHAAKARELRAEAIAQMLSGVGRGVARALRPLRARLGRWQERRRTSDALMRCSDRVLADIGIEREHIPLIAKGIDPSQYESVVAVAWRWWAAVRARLDAAAEARREQRRVYRELMAYQDRELDELGVRRADIAGIARGAPVLREAA